MYTSLDLSTKREKPITRVRSSLLENTFYDMHVECEEDCMILNIFKTISTRVSPSSCIAL